jgi:hypothetical protein
MQLGRVSPVDVSRNGLGSHDGFHKCSMRWCTRTANSGRDLTCPIHSECGC